jgi:hypothetical protein
MEKGNEIKLVQKPVISHKLKEIGKSVTERLEELNIDNLVATVDTVKSLKELRADLNKELKTFEEQRKLVKGAIAAPYQEFEEIYKAEISEKYTDAVEKLKDKISIVETQIKDEKRQEVETYFNELLKSESIDFLTWEKAGIDINLSTSVKKYKEEINALVTKTKDDLKLITTSEYQAEVLVEYKKSLNVAEAMTMVTEREEAKKSELERIKQAETTARIRKLDSLGFTHSEMGDLYEYKGKFPITRKEIQDMNPEEFTIKYMELEGRIREMNLTEEQKAKQPAAPVSAPTVEKPAQVQKAEQPATPEEAVDPNDRIVTAKFQATAKFSVLKALGQYMRDNNIEYKNI